MKACDISKEEYWTSRKCEVAYIEGKASSKDEDDDVVVTENSSIIQRLVSAAWVTHTLQ